MLKGRTALVTGSTSGIGLGIATRLAAEGANIVLNGFGERAEIERLSTELKTRCRVNMTYDAADMTKPAAIAAMLGKVIAQFGAVDVLVNNAGIQHAQPTKRFVGVEEVAGLTAFLCSQEAASITGALLPIDGGWTAQ